MLSVCSPREGRQGGWMQITTVCRPTCLLFYNCMASMEFLPWEIWVAFPIESQLPQSHATQPNVLSGCFSVSIIQWTLTWTTGCFNVCTDVSACEHMGVYGHHKRVCTENLLWEKNPLPHLGIEPASAVWRCDALTIWATSHSYQLCWPLLNSDAEWMKLKIVLSC